MAAPYSTFRTCVRKAVDNHRQTGAPNVMLTSDTPLLFRLRRCHWSPRTTPGVVVPFPSQSPATTRSVASPYERTTSATPEVLLLRRYQVFPRTTPGVTV